ncbi:DNA invertase Pin-like site-specific DNA recombinase [Acidovorax sp. 107]|uniref:recombinase family protein n=1 Tax=Acidovorax sp. 107 TaxID=2135638 RepID=UPI000D361C3C|nr:recombinase family protein [Acidovorax sp. 107]PUA99163.1 DNA invertase Pin-like site-specific DNA recombinase [Acidovorax sp. 107]
MPPETRHAAVAYYRVSTTGQEQSGLGLDAQREAVARYLKGAGWELVDAFTETETGKGSNALAKRPQLRAALELCKRRGATLVIAKLDRLARNVNFISGLLEAGCDFVAADMPQANKVMIQMHAVMAEWERDQISQRTKDALAASKASGTKLGTAGPANLRRNIEERRDAANDFAAKLAGVVEGFQARGLSQRRMVAELNTVGIKAPRGGAWSLRQVQHLLARLKADEPGEAARGSW